LRIYVEPALPAFLLRFEREEIDLREKRMIAAHALALSLSRAIVFLMALIATMSDLFSYHALLVPAPQATLFRS
jgi:hypothetical protein